jgi:hypothetical protein
MLIEALAEKMAKRDFVAAPKQTSPDAQYANTLKAKKSANNTPRVCFIRQLTFIPGISTSIADALTNVYPTMTALIQALLINESKIAIAHIADITHGSHARRIGPKAAEKIYHYLTKDE